MADDLVAHIKRYLLRKKVQVQSLGTQLQVNALLSQQVQNDVGEGDDVQLAFDERPDEDDLYKSLCYVDPRCRAMGLRTVSGNSL